MTNKKMVPTSAESKQKFIFATVLKGKREICNYTYN